MNIYGLKLAASYSIASGSILLETGGTAITLPAVVSITTAKTYTGKGTRVQTTYQVQQISGNRVFLGAVLVGSDQAFAVGSFADFTSPDPIDTLSSSKGALLVGTGAGYAALAVGADNQVLAASSAAPGGVAWVAASGGSGSAGSLLADSTGVAGFTTTGADVSFLSGGALAIPAASWVLGKMIRVEAWGLYTSLAAPGTVTFKVKLGSVVVLNYALAGNLPVSKTNFGWVLRGLFALTSAPGAAATFSGQGMLLMQSAAGSVGTGIAVNQTAAVAVDTTGSPALNVVVNQTALNTWSSTIAIIDALN